MMLPISAQNGFFNISPHGYFQALPVLVGSTRAELEALVANKGPEQRVEDLANEMYRAADAHYKMQPAGTA